MLLSYSPEGSFVLTLFELVLSGLSLSVLLWIRWREAGVTSKPASGYVVAGLAFLPVAFALYALHCQLALGGASSPDSAMFWLLFASEQGRLLAAAALSAGFLIQHGRTNRARYMATAALVLAAVACAHALSNGPASPDSIVPLTVSRMGEIALLVVGATLLGVDRGSRPALALMLLGLGRATAVLAAIHPAATELSWSIEHLATVAGLVALALSLERESRQVSVRFFLRLNLTFIVLASSLILVVTEIERRQLVNLSRLHTEDLAEFVRGHVLYYTSRGEAPDQVLAHTDITRKLVAEFGRYPDLRRVKVAIANRTMTLAIDDRHIIDQLFWIGERPVPPRVAPADFVVSSLQQVPIVWRDQQLGSVEIRHSLQGINQQIGWQMQLIFAVFTVFVTLASGATGMLVVAAERTIRGQYAELERTERRLSVAERLASIGAVADGVAHEINNPAGVLVARTGFLMAVTHDRAIALDIRDDLETIHRQAQRIAKTVKDLLAFTRPMPLSNEVFDIMDVVESASTLVRPMIAGGEIFIEIRRERNLPFVRGDRNRLEQVFMNLLVNAVQAIETAGRITVTSASRAGGTSVEILVRDTGSGIRPEDLNRIFDPFFTTKEPGAGTGLGLSIAYGIVRDHNGSLDVTSAAGHGTEFHVVLPTANGRPPVDTVPGQD